MPLASPLDVVALVPSSGKPVTNGIKKGNLRAYSWALPYISSMNILLNPRPNLLIDLSKNRIISYDTVVAEIDFKKGVITPTGKFTRTTSNHISYVSDWFGLATEKTDKKRNDFYEYQQGVKIRYSGALGEIASRKVVAGLKEFKDLTLSLVDAYNKTNKRSRDLDVLRGIISGLGADLEEVTKELNALKKVRDMVI